MRYRYYSLRRLEVPGGIPQGVVGIHEFDTKRYCPEVDREAWGYLEYMKPLKPQQIVVYELAAPVEKGCDGEVCEL